VQGPDENEKSNEKCHPCDGIFHAYTGRTNGNMHGCVCIEIIQTFFFMLRKSIEKKGGDKI
jgi:hypothetical protein